MFGKARTWFGKKAALKSPFGEINKNTASSTADKFPATEGQRKRRGCRLQDIV